MNESSLELKERERAMRNRIVTAVKQRFSIRKLSIGAASVLLGTSLYFMGSSAPVVHAATNGETPASSETSTDSKDPVSVAGQSKYSDVDVNNAIDQYAEKNQDAVNEQEEKEKTGNKVIIRPSDKQPVTVYNTTDRKTQVENIIQKEINDGITKANQNWDKIQEYKKNHNDKQILNGTESDYFENQGLSIDDEKGSEINKITVDGKTKDIGENTKIADFNGIDITHTSNMTDKEKYTMKVNSNNKVIVDFQTAQCQGKETTVTKEITVTYDNLNNSYYLQNKTNRIKISRIDRTFSSIQVADNPHLFNPNGQYTYKNDAIYDKCDGPQLIIYNDPSDGFFYNNIKQISVKDTYYYDDKGKQTPINFDTKDPAWFFVTSLNSNGGGNIEKVRALDSNDSPLSAQKIAGSTVTTDDHNDGWCYSDNNNFGQNLDWDNNNEYNRFGFVGTVAFQYQPGMTLQYRADDSQWGSHWACMQTQVVSSLNENVIIYGHIKDSTENVTRNDTVTRTIHYLYDNSNTAQPDKTQTVSFDETGTKDDVTGDITWSNDNAQTVDSVDTPNITGYTPDKSSIEKQDFKFGDQDVEFTVTYNANAQTATITYIDDTDKKTLGSDSQNGKFNQAITFEHDPTAKIASYEKQGYVLVSNSFNNNKYQANDNNNVFYVHLKHGTKNVSRNDDVNMTVHYVMDDNSEAPSDSKQTVNFTENGIQDLVTPTITWTPADSQTLNNVNSPVLTGYTADIKTANGKIVNFGDPDINVTVTYHANAQTAKITYIDDTTKNNLDSKDASGKFGQAITFKHDPAEVIKGLEEKGYKLVSNNFKQGIKYQNDNKFNIFEVHLVHTYEPVETSQTITETIHYIDVNGKPVAPDHVAKAVIEMTGTRDKVTDSITWNTPSTGHFDEVISPEVPNMTPDKKFIPSRNVQYGDSDITENVVYTSDETSREPEKPNDQGKSSSKNSEKTNKSGNSTSKTSEKSNDQGKPNSKTSKKPNNSDNSTSMPPKKTNKSGKDVSKQFGTLTKATISEKSINSRTADNGVSTKSTAKQELPQTGATTNIGIWTGLVSMIASLGLLGASKKRKKN